MKNAVLAARIPQGGSHKPSAGRGGNALRGTFRVDVPGRSALAKLNLPRKEGGRFDLNQRLSGPFLASVASTTVLQSVTGREGCNDRFH